MKTTTAMWMMAGTAIGTAMLTTRLLRPPEPRDLLDPVVLVGQVRDMARLQTASMSLHTTVQGARGDGAIRALAGETLVFQGVGQATAGVDLAALGPEDLWVDGEGTVWVRLPEAEVFGVALDEARSRVLARETGWFGRADRDLETEARRAAVGQLRAQAEVVGLREAAAEGAREVVRDLLLRLGAPEVRFADDGGPATLW